MFPSFFRLNYFTLLFSLIFSTLKGLDFFLAWIFLKSVELVEAEVPFLSENLHERIPDTHEELVMWYGLRVPVMLQARDSCFPVQSRVT